MQFEPLMSDLLWLTVKHGSIFSFHTPNKYVSPTLHPDEPNELSGNFLPGLNMQHSCDIVYLLWSTCEDQLTGRKNSNGTESELQWELLTEAQKQQKPTKLSKILRHRNTSKENRCSNNDNQETKEYTHWHNHGTRQSSPGEGGADDHREGETGSKTD